MTAATTAYGAAYLLDEAEGLPPKPPAPEGRAVLWVYVLGEPGFVYRGAPYHVDADVIDGVIARHKLLARRGYSPPLAAQHPKAIHDTAAIKELIDLAEGLRAGDVLDLARVKLGGKQALIAAVCPAMPAEDVARAVALGQIKYFSPGLGPVETDEGDVLSFVLKELSLVTAPHQKTAASHVLAAEQEAPPMEPEEKDLTPEERMAALEAAVSEMRGLMVEMAEKVKCMEPAPEEDEPEVEVTMGEQTESAEIVALRMKVTALEREAFVARFPVGAVVTLTEADADLFFAHKPSRDLLARAKAPAQRGLSPIGGERPAPQDPQTPEALRAACLAEAKGDEAAATKLYLTRRKAQTAGGSL